MRAGRSALNSAAASRVAQRVTPRPDNWHAPTTEASCVASGGHLETRRERVLRPEKLRGRSFASPPQLGDRHRAQQCHLVRSVSLRHPVNTIASVLPDPPLCVLSYQLHGKVFLDSQGSQ